MFWWCGMARADDLGELSLEDLLELEVVTPAAPSRPAVEVPIPVHVYDAETIRLRGYHDLGELLDDVPEIEIQHGASPDKGDLVTVRGVMGNEKLLLLVDGIRAGALDGTPLWIGPGYPLAN